MEDDTAMMDNEPDAPSSGADSFATEPLSMLHKATRNNAQVLINVRNNQKVRLYHSHSFVHACVCFQMIFFLVCFLCLFPLLIRFITLGI